MTEVSMTMNELDYFRWSKRQTKRPEYVEDGPERPLKMILSAADIVVYKRSMEVRDADRSNGANANCLYEYDEEDSDDDVEVAVRAEFERGKTKPVLSAQTFARTHSSMPLWQLANKLLKKTDAFEEPPAEMRQLHRLVSNNISGLEVDGVLMCMLSHIAMLLSTKVVKKEDTLGREQCGALGGPYLCFSRTRAPPPSAPGKYRATEVMGLTQTGKTDEEAAQAYADAFLEGILPTIWVRNRSGKNTGTPDMVNEVLALNAKVRQLFEKIWRENKAYQRVRIDDFRKLQLTPRCCSSSERLKFCPESPYRLLEPQVIIACTNAKQVKTCFQEVYHFGLTLPEIFAGVEIPHHEANNPYLPHQWDPQCRRAKTSISGIFDESDQTKSATGRERRDHMLHCNAGDAMHRLTDALGVYAEYDDDAEEEEEGAEEEAEGDALLMGLKAHLASVVGYTATPTAWVHSAGGDAQCEALVHVVEMIPSSCYVGFDTPHLRTLAPHCHTFVEVEILPPRAWSRTLCAADVESECFRMYLGAEDPPPQMYRTAGGVLKLNRERKHETVDVRLGEARPPMTAEELFDVVRQAKAASRGTRRGCWAVDGENATRILRDMEDARDAYPYRNVLVMSNYTRTDAQKAEYARAVLSADGDAAPDLTRSLVVIEWSFQYVRVQWRAGEVDESRLHDAFQRTAHTARENLRVQRGDAQDRLAVEAGVQACEQLRALLCATGDVRAVCLRVSNINVVYTALHAYMDGAFLKILVLAGEIGGRGARYKTHVGHHLVLTDLFYLFDTPHDREIQSSAAMVIQNAGRITGMVRDPRTAPRVKWWTTLECKEYHHHWLETMGTLPALYREQKELETVEDTIQRVVEHGEEKKWSPLHTHFCAPTGVHASGTLLGAHLDCRKAKNKRSFAAYSRLAEDAGRRVATVLEDAEEAEQRSKRARMHACIPPPAGWESALWLLRCQREDARDEKALVRLWYAHYAALIMVSPELEESTKRDYRAMAEIVTEFADTLDEVPISAEQARAFRHTYQWDAIMLRKYQKSEQATKENTKNRTSHIGKGADMFLKFLFGDVPTCTETEVRRRLEKHLLETPSLRVYTKEAFGGPKPRVTRA